MHVDKVCMNIVPSVSVTDLFKLLCKAYRLEVTSAKPFRLEVLGKCLIDIGAHHLEQVAAWETSQTITHQEVKRYLDETPISAAGAFTRTFVFGAKALIAREEKTASSSKVTDPSCVSYNVYYVKL
jgi:hypothetical protein